MVLINSFDIFLLVLFIGATVTQAAPPPESTYDDYPDYDQTEEPVKPTCDVGHCMLPNCSCFGATPDIPLPQRPQFVMLTFDDAITVANIGTYRKIANGRRNKDGKNIQMTFFVCHEYNDYTLSNELYVQGHEIAVHSVSHESDTDMWRNATEDRWKREMVGMRVMMNSFGGIPQNEILGHRAPFLQTGGDKTFRVLKREGFLYDSSMPSRYMDPPIWPYTLDYGYQQDCQIKPCPEESFAGFWAVPMIQYYRPSKEGGFYCSMVDACTPYPVTESDTKDFLMQNFLRHYHSNKAPFPVFMHEAWLRDKNRLAGYLQFLDELLRKPDVFVVSVRNVLEYIRNPVTIEQLSVRSQQPPATCQKIELCSYEKPLRMMNSCSKCPPFYPWVGTPLGKRPPKLL